MHSHVEETYVQPVSQEKQSKVPSATVGHFQNPPFEAIPLSVSSIWLLDLWVMGFPDSKPKLPERVFWHCLTYLVPPKNRLELQQNLRFPLNPEGSPYAKPKLQATMALLPLHVQIPSAKGQDCSRNSKYQGVGLLICHAFSSTLPVTIPLQLPNVLLSDITAPCC
eukprot:Lithocolla_globosa_v1_NODE_3174_length_1741_cov_3.469751.p2 type:complete len:166 gc:universal NODE_3174_length_1741_cov_3.469751:656-1153(+)